MANYCSLAHTALLLPCLLLLLTRASLGSAADFPFLDGSNITAVLILHEAPGYSRATVDSEYSFLYRDNIDDDFKKYKAMGGKFRLSKLARQAAQSVAASRYMVLVLIKNNSIYVYRRSDIPPFAATRVHALAQRMATIHQMHNLTYPDTLFILNTEDVPYCNAPKKCQVPQFTYFKQYDYKKQRPIQDDILLPHFGRSYDSLIFYPWSKKDNRGMMRGAMQRTMSVTSTRYTLAKLTASKEGKDLLDCGMVSNSKPGFTLPRAHKKKFINLSNHAKWKFLLNADGHTASCRLGQIMQTNSVVLKQDSPWIEYYYRSLKANKHYISYNKDNILSVMKDLQNPAMDDFLRNLANTSQHFVHKYLTAYGKAMYTRQALIKYNSMFPGLQEFVARVDTRRSQGPDFSQILRKMTNR